MPRQKKYCIIIKCYTVYINIFNSIHIVINKNQSLIFMAIFDLWIYRLDVPNLFTESTYSKVMKRSSLI